MSKYVKGTNLVFNGQKVVITAVNADGTATLHYASGSGKTGFAGTLPSLDVSPTNKTTLTSFSEENLIVETVDEFDTHEEAASNGYIRGKIDVYLKYLVKIEKGLKQAHNMTLLNSFKQLKAGILVKRADLKISIEGKKVEHLTVRLTEKTMSIYNKNHGVGMREAHSEVKALILETDKTYKLDGVLFRWFQVNSVAKKTIPPSPTKKQSVSKSQKSPQDYLRLARYMYIQTVQHAGEFQRHKCWKQYQHKVMELYGLSESQSFEMITKNLSNKQGIDPEPISS
jgi:hypothetical protein